MTSEGQPIENKSHSRDIQMYQNIRELIECFRQLLEKEKQEEK